MVTVAYEARFVKGIKKSDILPTINGGASQQEEAEAGEKFVNVV